MERYTYTYLLLYTNLPREKYGHFLVFYLKENMRAISSGQDIQVIQEILSKSLYCPSILFILCLWIFYSFCFVLAITAFVLLFFDFVCVCVFQM